MDSSGKNAGVDPSFWVNYNDLTATSLESWLVREMIPKWPYFRLVNYCNLPRSLETLEKKSGGKHWNVLCDRNVAQKKSTSAQKKEPWIQQEKERLGNAIFRGTLW